MLQIRLLSKAASSELAGSKPVVSENVTVSCPEYLVLADLPVAKSLGGVSTVNVVKIVGRRSRRQVGAKVHFCVRCNLPIAIYGRLSPCEHAFCLTCARNDSSCYLCDERIQKIQTIKMLEGIFICAAPHCLKSFLKRMDFELHLVESHSDLFPCKAEKDDLHEKDVIKARPVSSDPQPKKPSLQPQSKDALVTSVTGQQEIEEKIRHDHSKRSSATQQQDDEQISKSQTHQKHSSYHLCPQEQWDYQGDSGDSTQQLYQEKQRSFEKSHHQSHQEKRQKVRHGEKHRKHHDKRQEVHADTKYHQADGPHQDDIHQRDTGHQNTHGQQPQKLLTSKPESPHVIPPSFPMQPLQYPYPIHPEGFQQHYNPHYHPTQPFTFQEGLPLQTGIQNFQDGNQGMSMLPSSIQDFQENQIRPWDIRLSGMLLEATTTVHALHEGNMALDRQGQFSHFPIDYGPGPTRMPLPPPLQSMGMGLDQPIYYQDSSTGPLLPTPHKQGKYLNMHTEGEDNHRGRGGRPSFDTNHR